MKCLVLGGAGFLGADLSRLLFEQGYAVRVFDRQIRTFDRDTYPDMEFFEGDFLNQHDIDEAVTGCDAIFHLISTTVPKSSNDDPIYDVESNVVGTLHVLNAAVRHKVKKIIFPSSGGTVYGIPEYIPIREDHPTRPICSYGINKLEIERYLYLFKYLHGLEYSILRVSNPYGCGQRPDVLQGAVGVFAAKAVIGEPVEIWGDGSVVRDYLHVSDVSKALIKALQYSGEINIFNIGSGEGKSLNEILDVMDAAIGTTVVRIYKHAREMDVPTNILDNTLAGTELSWSPDISFQDGVFQLVRAIKGKQNA